MKFRLSLLGNLLLLVGFSDVGEGLYEPGWASLEEFLARPLLSLRGPALTLAMRAVTWLGEWQWLLLVVLVSGAFLKRRERGVFWSLAVAASLCNWGLKLWFLRARPGAEFDPLVTPSGYSFPSGHSTTSLAIYGFLAYLGGRRFPSQRPIIIAFVATLVVLIGFSRIYLGAHYPGDVLGGFAVGWLCLWMAVESLGRTRAEEPDGDGRTPRPGH